MRNVIFLTTGYSSMLLKNWTSAGFIANRPSEHKGLLHRAKDLRKQTSE